MNYIIDEKLMLKIGDISQSVRIRSCDPSSPLLLFLHGGPGVCDRHWVLRDQSSLAQVATMVCWDQRGAGLSWSKDLKSEDMTVSRFVEDAHELIAYLKKRFEKTKVYVVGHSWGTALGTLLAQKYPEDVAVYIGMGQFVNGPENEDISYDFVLEEAKKRNDKKALQDLDKIGRPINGLYRSLDDLMVQRNLMTKYGGEDYGENDGIIKSMLIPLIKSQEYSLPDLWKYYKGTFLNLESMWNEVVGLRFDETVKELKMPVYLTEGRHDQNTPIPIAQRWFDQLKAPYKEWIWFEKSAHSPIKNEPELWGQTVKQIVLKEEVNNSTSI
ncbi:MAG: alpha/beta hydrolase [Erysipelotrichaceae bacterium]|nr:alpha/beta hydrolase [Erysipelotrichaceae bacterium]